MRSAIVDFVKSQTSGLGPVAQMARQRFLDLGLPSRTDELWKYTSTKKLMETEFDFGDVAGEISPTLSEASDIHFEADARIVFLNGKFRESSSHLTPSISLTGSENNSIIDTSLLTSFEALNMTLAKGHTIEVRDTGSPQCIHLTHFVDGGERMPAVFSRVTVNVGARTKITFIESFVGQSRYFRNTSTFFRLQESASMELIRIQDESMESSHVSRHNIEMKSGATLRSTHLSFGAAWSRNDFEVVQVGENGSAFLDGLYLASQGQHMDHHTSVEHRTPHGVSEQRYKGILSGEARAVFNGKIHIFPKAQKVESRQLNKNLLLSHKAHVDTKPELEIHADDVKANHGATIGQLSDEELFYLESRGINRQLAVQMIAYGFAKDVIFRIEDAQIKNTLSSLIEKRVSSLYQGVLRGSS